MTLTLLAPPDGHSGNTGRHGPSAARMERIRKVQKLRLMGLKIREIAVRSGISERMVRHDLRDGKQLYRDAAQLLDQQVFIGEQLALLQLCQESAMRDYLRFRNESNKVGALRLVAEFHHKMLTLLQSVGLVREMPRRLTLEDSSQTNPFEDPEFMEEFDAIILKARAKGVKIFGL